MKAIDELIFGEREDVTAIDRFREASELLLAPYLACSSVPSPSSGLPFRCAKVEMVAEDKLLPLLLPATGMVGSDQALEKCAGWPVRSWRI